MSSQETATPVTRTTQHRLQAIRRFSDVLAVVAGLGTIALMCLTVADVASRQFRGRSLAGAIELSGVALVAVVFLGMAAAQIAGQHVSSPVMTSRLSPTLASRVRLLGLVMSVAIVLWILQGTIGAAVESVRVNEARYGLARVPIWPAKLSIPLGLLCLLLVLAVQLVAAFRDVFHHEGAQEPDTDDAVAPSVRPQGEHGSNQSGHIA